MLNCQEITRLFSESQERSLSWKERMWLKMHVTMCSGCRNFGKQMDALRQVSHSYVKGEDERAEK
ncbi:MAG: zf-HC2 domain-containing protein [Nitrosospira sp.]